MLLAAKGFSFVICLQILLTSFLLSSTKYFIFYLFYFIRHFFGELFFADLASKYGRYGC